MRILSLSMITAALSALTACGEPTSDDLELEAADLESAELDSLERSAATKLVKLRDQIDLLEERIAELEDANCVTEEEIGSLLALAPYVEVDDGTNDIRFVGANVHVQNGADSATPNGLGNLIVGFNDDDGTRSRTGSHNLVIGPLNSYTSLNGLVTGDNSTISGYNAVVVGGSGSTASGSYAAVVGGGGAQATGFGSSVYGGHFSQATGWFSHVVGGYDSLSSAEYSSALGGVYTSATGYGSTAVAGYGTSATGTYVFVSP